MRDIKFRAWNKEKNIMCYENEDNSSRYLDGWDASDIEVINQTLNSDFTKEIYDFMEFTGLKDKNGKEIYEGDIVELNEVGRKLFGSENVLARQHEVVGFKDGAFMTGRLEFYPFGFNTYLWIIRDYIEVIGNIYENPELLEGKEEN